MKSQAHDVDQYRIRPGAKVALHDRPTLVDPLAQSKAEYQEQLAAHRERIIDLQDVMYAHDRYAVLMVLQGMDTAGKDGVVKHVLAGVNPQGCQVHSFKQPSDEELDHDFLWRTTSKLPGRGEIGVFNRSYYEEVLIVRAQPSILVNERLPDDVVNVKHLWSNRYRDIVNHEEHLHHSGTRVVKFFLHISKDEQRKRLLARLDEPDKNWKARQSDIDVRQLWDELQEAYQDALAATSTELAPWYVIPADHKPTARLLVAKVLVDTLESLKMNYPVPDEAHRAELAEMRRVLENEKK
jgi:PPK2 family polyphosphate:nucleotide phosphotransferase